MNRQLTVVLVAVVGVVAVAGGAVLFTGQSGGADAAPAANDAAAVEQSTPTSQPSDPIESTDQPTTDATATSESDVETATPADADDRSADRANEPPTADAGENATTREWVLTTLDASGSTDPDGDDANLTYRWSQTAGDEVELRTPDSATTKFFAPESKLETELAFEVTVTDEDGATATDTVTIDVRESRDSDDETKSNASADGNQTADGDQTDVEDDPESDDEGDASDGGDADSATADNDTIAQAKFGSDFEDLNAGDAATVYELHLRQPDGNWDPSSVRTRDELAREAYNDSFENLAFEARVDVQERFDAQFGDTGGPISKSNISTAKWGEDNTFEELSDESAGQVTELYDRQPWVDDTETEHVRTREMWAYRLYDEAVEDLSRGERLEVERRYHEQFGD